MTAEAFTAALRVELFRLDREASVLSAKRASVADLLALYVPPLSADPSTADPGADPLPPLAHQEGSTQEGDMGIPISEPEGGALDAPNPPQNMRENITAPVSSGNDAVIPGEKIRPLAPGVVLSEPAPFIPPAEMVAARMVAAERRPQDWPATIEDPQGGEEPAPPAAAPAPVEQPGEQAGGEAPPAANVEPRLPKLPALSEAHRARIWALYVSGWDVPEIAEKTGVSLSKINAIIANVEARAIWVPGRKVFWDGKRAQKPVAEPEPDPEPIPEPVLSLPSKPRLAGPDELDEQGWSLRMDRDLMHGRACGKSDGNLATKLGRKPPEIRARVAYLLADMGGTEAQAFRTLEMLLGQVEDLAAAERQAAE